MTVRLRTLVPFPPLVRLAGMLFFFLGRRQTADLSFAKPLDHCCNCGSEGDIDLVETPMRQVRFYFVFGTELVLREEFPYCKRCRRSAKRERPGMLSRLLMSALTTMALFVVIVFAAPALPPTMQSSPFYWSAALGVVATFAYVAFQSRRGSTRSYYQPVRLVKIDRSVSGVQRLCLEFANAAYCRLFAQANAGDIQAGALKVQTAGS